MNPLEYLKAFKRRWTVIAGTLALALVAGWVTTSVAPVEPPAPFYSATTVLLSPGSATGVTTSGFTGVGNLNTLAALATVGEVPERVKKVTGSDMTAEQLALVVQAFADVETGLLRITASSPDPEEAELLANTFAEELIRFLKDTRIESLDKGAGSVGAQMDRLEEQIADLDARIGSSTNGLLIAQRDAKVRQYGLLYEQYQQLAGAASESIDLQIVQRGVPQVVASQGFQPPQTRTSRLALAGILGLLAGVVIALLLERFDTRIRSKASAEKHFQIPVIAEIPHIRRKMRRKLTIGGTSPRSPVGDAFRFMAAALMLSPTSTTAKVFARNAGKLVEGSDRPPATEDRRLPGDAGTSPRPPTRNGMQIRVHTESVDAARPVRPSSNGHRHAPTNGHVEHSKQPPTPAPKEETKEGPRTILVTSPGPDEGKTTTVANLAAAFGELGLKVIVLSCDFRRPAIHEHFGLENAHGLSDALALDVSGPVLNGNVRETFVKNVRVLPSGTASERPGELLSSNRMREALNEARSEADMVLLDSPPLMTAGEATLLLREVDGVLILCRAGKTTSDAAERSAEVLRRLGAPLIGAALTDSDTGVLPYYYPIREAKRGLALRSRTDNQREMENQL